MQSLHDNTKFQVDINTTNTKLNFNQIFITSIFSFLLSTTWLIKKLPDIAIFFLYYSREYYDDNTLWSVWDGTGEIASGKEEGEEKQRLYIRGKGNGYLTTFNGGGDSKGVLGAWVMTNNVVISAYGGVSHLLAYDTARNGQSIDSQKWCFSNLFYNCKSLKYPPRIDLYPVAHGAFEWMFAYSGIIEAPCMNGTYKNDMSIANYVYAGMFRNCADLISLPNFPGGYIWQVDQAYNVTFKGCKKLYFWKQKDRPSVSGVKLYWGQTSKTDSYNAGSECFYQTANGDVGYANYSDNGLNAVWTTNRIVGRD